MNSNIHIFVCVWENTQLGTYKEIAGNSDLTSSQSQIFICFLWENSSEDCRSPRDPRFAWTKLVVSYECNTLLTI